MAGRLSDSYLEGDFRYVTMFVNLLYLYRKPKSFLIIYRAASGRNPKRFLYPVSDNLGNVNIRGVQSDRMRQETRNGSDNIEILLMTLESS